MEPQSPSALLAKERNKQHGPPQRRTPGKAWAILLTSLALMVVAASLSARTNRSTPGCASLSILGLEARLCISKTSTKNNLRLRTEPALDGATVDLAEFDNPSSLKASSAARPWSHSQPPKPNLELQGSDLQHVQQAPDSQPPTHDVVLRGSTSQQVHQQAPGNVTWRTLTDFVQLCDQYLPGMERGIAQAPARSISGSRDILEVLATRKFAKGTPRNITHVLQALHKIPQTEKGISALAGRELEALPSRGCVTKPMQPPSIPAAGQPRIGILMISSGAPGYFHLSAVNKQRYADRHGYHLHVLPHLDETRHPAWSKVPAALSLLPMYDWLWLVDADTLVMTPSIPLTKYIDDSFDMVLTRDCNGINTGSWLIRNSQWTEAMLAAIYARPDAEPKVWWEQAALIQLAGLPGVSKRIKVLPTNKGLNSYGMGSCGGQGGYTEGDLLVHFPGVPDKETAFHVYWLQLRPEDQ